MRRLLAAVCAVLTVAALVTACAGGRDAVHGTVTAKDVEPVRTTWTTGTRYRQACTTKTRRSGKKTRTVRSCHDVPNGTRRIIHRTPACWGLDISTGDHVCVTAAKWLKTHVGDRI